MFYFSYMMALFWVFAELFIIIYIKKGISFIVQDGKKHYMTEVVGFNMVMLDPKGTDTSTNAPEPPESPVPDSDITSEPSTDIPKEEDDLPF